MSIRVVPFTAAHLETMRVQPRQAKNFGFVTYGYLEVLAANGPALTALEGDVPLLAGGLYQEAHQATLWGFVAADAGRQFIALHRALARLLSLYVQPRIEATVEADFDQGCRWLELLGFSREALLPGFGAGGEDHLRYARIL